MGISIISVLIIIVRDRCALGLYRKYNSWNAANRMIKQKL